MELLPPLPPPEIPARLARPEELTRTAKPLIELAVEYGWNVRSIYARGTLRLGKDGRNGFKVVDGLQLTMRHPDGRFARATWIDGRIDSAVLWGRGLGCVPALQKTLREWITDETTAEHSFEEIQTILTVMDILPVKSVTVLEHGTASGQ